MKAKNNENIDTKTIESEIVRCLQDIDGKYYNKDFNLIGEIVNIMGDINFDKVKLDIERLNRINEKLDRVIKLIVDKHSDEFFKILGFVRLIQKEIDSGKVKLSDAKEILTNIANIIGNLKLIENTDWKLRSIYFTEIISKLNKTQRMFKIIQDCDIYIENDKVLDAIMLMKRSQSEHQIYDKEFRGFDFIVNITIRFKNIEESIEEKILSNLNSIIFFNNDEILDKKIGSLIVYLLTSYGKMSIDNELVKPLNKFMLVIKNIVIGNLASYNFEMDNKNSEYFNDNVVDLDSSKKLSSLVYLVKCLKFYERGFNVFMKMNEKITENITNLLERTFRMVTDSLKMIDYSKYDMDNKTDKIKFLLFFQIFLLIVYHSYAKIAFIDKYVNNKEISEIISKILQTIEKTIFLPLVVYSKLTGFRRTSDENITDENVEYAPGENLIRMKINEILIISIDYLPILYKIYYKFSDTVEKIHSNKLVTINNQLNTFNSHLFKYYSKKIIPKKFFDISTFLTEFDGDSSNFKFINEFIKKVNKLKELLVFGFDNSFIELIKIIKELFTSSCT